MDYGSDCLFCYKSAQLKGIKTKKSYTFMGYELFNYPDEVKFLAEGDRLEDMFVSAGDALNEVVRGDIKILEQDEKMFIVEGENLRELLYGFLDAFLIFLSKEDFLVSRIVNIKILNGKIECVVAGDSAENYKFTNDVKTISYDNVSFKDESEKFSCQVILDVC